MAIGTTQHGSEPGWQKLGDRVTGNPQKDFNERLHAFEKGDFKVKLHAFGEISTNVVFVKVCDKNMILHAISESSV